MEFNTYYNKKDYWMVSNGLYAGFNMPPAIKSQNGKNGDEVCNGLPPYLSRKPFLVDEYPACPENWMRSEGKLTSYFIPVKKDYGMWLDFNKNTEKNYHVAIVVSIQGVNPITGMPCKDPCLEQYIETCPKHKEKFGPNRFCKKCGYKWPKQNYLCTTGTPNGSFWLDGFRAADGMVRQYMLTNEKIRGVASNIIGKDRVFAIGISFFLSKTQKPEQKIINRGGWDDDVPSSSVDNDDILDYKLDIKYNNTATKGGGWSKIKCGKTTYDSSKIDVSYKSSDTFDEIMTVNTCDVSSLTNATLDGNWPIAVPPAAGACAASDNDIEDLHRLGVRSAAKPDRIGNVRYCCKESTKSAPKSVSVKKIEIGAGANINQQVYDDPEPLDFWRTEPESILCVNYCLEEEALKILASGKVDVEGSKEGYLKEIPVGNFA